VTIDLDRVRRETPGCAEVLHFNNAGASLMPRPVLDALVGHLQFEARIGGYEAADQAAAEIDHVYDALARLLNARRDEIAFVENATRAWDMAFYSMRFERGDRILTGTAEYASNYIAFLQVASRTGAVVEAIPNDEHGQISLPALRRAIDGRVKLIALTHVPTNGGLVNPAAAVGRVAREARIPYLLDACQSIGQIPLDVEAIGCDMLSGTGRKYLRGPRATGFLYVSPALLDRLEPPFLDVHAATWLAPDRYEVRPDARRFENWETYFAGKRALGVAVDYALELGIEPIRDRVVALAEELRAQLAATPGVRVHDLGVERCGIVTFTVSGVDPDAVKERLARKRINVTTSSRQSTLLDMDSRGLPMLVRASVHYYNTEDEIARLVEAVGAIN
jgi:cysteine desulfurase / selenocysteine lyase